MGDFIDRLEAAEAELARRDEAAGESVYQVGTDGHWYDCKEYIYQEAKQRRDACRILYTNAQPSALPPQIHTRQAIERLEKEESPGTVNVAYKWGYNQAIADAKALGCKAIKLPDYVDDLHGVGPVLSLEKVIDSLLAQGFSVEVE
ncbi:MAG: hypothetical protein WBW72_02350 [Erwinia billingiae]